jgi:putative transposase
MGAIDEHREIGVRSLCAALAMPRETYYRRRRPTRVCAPVVKEPPLRALCAQEKQRVLETLHSERFVDRSPAEVVATLLDEGTYHCSERTMYRVLAGAREVRERRNQTRHPQYAKPELLAKAPNQVWSWDITKLLGPAKWTYYYLYVVLDIYSRYVVGWLLAHRECAELARRLVRETCERQAIDPDELILHSDRGTPMTSRTLSQTLASLGVGMSFSRPHVSNDNPFSESAFKTLKYGPGFPDRFASFDHALAHCRRFFSWYNEEHRHGGLAELTPADVHLGHAEHVLARREDVLRAAFASHPERFVHGRPAPRSLPAAVYINPPPQAVVASVMS